MSRVLVSAAVALVVALAVPATVSATEPSPVSGSTGQCVLFTLVPSDSDEAQADVYIAKESPVPLPPENPEPGDILPYLDRIVDQTLDQVKGTTPSSGYGDVLVDVIVPANSDAGTGGYRIGLMLDLSNCSIA